MPSASGTGSSPEPSGETDSLRMLHIPGRRRRVKGRQTITACTVAAAIFLCGGQTLTSPRYAECISLLETDLAAGRLFARQWVDNGGGARARYCLARADHLAGFPALAAARLEMIATRDDAGDNMEKARLLSAASLMWLEAGRTDTAGQALEKAFSLAPDSAELRPAAARIHAARGNWQSVIDAVDAAVEAGLATPDLFVLRGEARMIQADYRAAADDVIRALTLDPENIDALLLRGRVQQTGIAIGVSIEDG